LDAHTLLVYCFLIKFANAPPCAPSPRPLEGSGADRVEPQFDFLNREARNPQPAGCFAKNGGKRARRFNFFFAFSPALALPGTCTPEGHRDDVACSATCTCVRCRQGKCARSAGRRLAPAGSRPACTCRKCRRTGCKCRAFAVNF
jgi:hypothetical protein